MSSSLPAAADSGPVGRSRLATTGHVLAGTVLLVMNKDPGCADLD